MNKIVVGFFLVIAIKSIAPVRTAWGRMPNTKDYTCTIIIIHFKVKENIADFIMAPTDRFSNLL